MRGIDTNVLVRYLTQDDSAQASRVDRLFRTARVKGEPLHVDTIVLCEVVWVLRELYRYGKPDVVAALTKILDVIQFSIDDRDLMREAIGAYAAGRGDFADYVVGLRNKRAGCSETATFDRALDRSVLFAVL